MNKIDPNRKPTVLKSNANIFYIFVVFKILYVYNYQI